MPAGPEAFVRIREWCCYLINYSHRIHRPRPYADAMLSTPGRPVDAAPEQSHARSASSRAEIPDTPRWPGRRRRIAVGAALLAALVATAFLFYSLGSTRTPQALPTASPKPSPS